MVSSPCVGWIWSDPNIPRCICCTTKACAPWIDECNWLELVVQSCTQTSHIKRRFICSRFSRTDRKVMIDPGTVGIWRLLAGFFIYYLLWLTEILRLKCTRVVSFEKGKKSQPGHTVTRQARIPARSPFIWKTTNDKH
jgi:hypothetical protein